MHNRISHRWRSILTLTVALMAWALSTTLVAAQNPNPGVLPPQSSPYGKNYGEWSAEHWKWLYSLPVDAHPLFDTADCSAGQSGQVWFLGGTFTVVVDGNDIKGIATRNCTIPSGTALFFPIIDAECATIEANGTTDAELRACAKGLIDAVDPADLTLVIDGQSVSNLAAYRVQSPLFTFGPLPANNVLASFGLDAPAGAASPSVSDGYFVMVRPLSVGKHTIHFTGLVDLGSFKFSLDITYHLTVVPRGRLP